MRSAVHAVLQTPPGRGGIAVIALRGEAAERVLSAVFRPRRGHSDGGRGVLQLGHVADREGRVLDEAVVLQGDGRAEINIHGGPAAARAVLERLAELGATIDPPGRRPAGKAPFGDFLAGHPRWHNPAIGREMLAALPAVASERVLAILTTQWSAGLSELAATALRAVLSGVSGGGRESAAALRRAAAGLERTERLLHPAEIVLAGPPNSGKSTLANALVGRAVSIVHDAPGTTRDWVRELALLDGVPVWITDTAGLLEAVARPWVPPAQAEIDAEAVRRARQRLRQADVLLALGWDNAPSVGPAGERTRTIRVWARCDLAPCREPGALAVSALTGEGMPELRRAILAAVGLDELDPAEPTAFTPRQADLARRAADAFDRGDAPAAATAFERLLRGTAPQTIDPLVAQPFQAVREQAGKPVPPIESSLPRFHVADDEECPG